MQFLKWFLTWGIFFGCAVSLSILDVPPAKAVVDVSSDEVQASASLILPSAASLGTVDGYSTFTLESKTTVEGGLLARYQARLLDDPWFESELPTLQLLMYTYSSQEAAEDTFEQLSGLASFSNGDKTLLASDSHTLYYQSNFGGNGVDVFGTVSAEYKALHLLKRSGNLIFQATLFRGNGEYNANNLQTYASMIAKTDAVKTVLSAAIESSSTALGLLFPPSQSFWASKNESSSLNLSASQAIPTHGTLHLSVYVSDPGAAVGTILDSSGINTPTEGDLYLYINSNGKLFAGIYAPAFDANCTQEAGWYRIESNSALYPYEWNTIDLHYGVGGFSLKLNNVSEATCSVSQPRSKNPLYLGDFPGDALSESMLGYVDDFSATYSLTTLGEVWDTVLTKQLFFDLPDTDPDLDVFQYLKEKDVFTGSDGMLYPDAVLNRAQMVKVVLRAFKRNPDVGSSVPFSDIPANAWYRKYLAKGYQVGIIQGHENGAFLPEHSINRAEFFTMLYRLNGSKRLEYKGEFSDVDEEDWFALPAAYARSKGILRGTTFGPEKNVTRREAAKVLYALMQKL